MVWVCSQKTEYLSDFVHSAEVVIVEEASTAMWLCGKV